MVQTGIVNTGYHHHTVMLLADDQTALDHLIHQSYTLLFRCWFSLSCESLWGKKQRFWGAATWELQIILHAVVLITSQNFADFCPLHNYRVGYRDGNYLGSAVTLLEIPLKLHIFCEFP